MNESLTDEGKNNENGGFRMWSCADPAWKYAMLLFYYVPYIEF